MWPEHIAGRRNTLQQYLMYIHRTLSRIITVRKLCQYKQKSTSIKQVLTICKLLARASHSHCPLDEVLTVITYNPKDYTLIYFGTLHLVEVSHETLQPWVTTQLQNSWFLAKEPNKLPSGHDQISWLQKLFKIFTFLKWTNPQGKISFKLHIISGVKAEGYHRL